MPMIMTRTFDRVGVVYNAKDDEYAFISDGQVGYDREEFEFKELFFKPKGGELSTTPEESDVVFARIRATVQKKENTVADYKLSVQLCNTEVSTGSAGGVYNADTTYMQGIILENTTEQQEVALDLTYAAFVKAIKYGFKLTSTSAEYAKITACTLEAEVYSVLTPPVVTVRPDLMSNGYVDKDGTYIHMPNKPFTVRYNYEQEKGAEMLAMGVEMMHQNYTGAEDYEGEASASETEYTFDKQRWAWNYVPQEGKIGLRASANAVSKVTYSDIVYLPYKIAHRNVQFTHYASGDVIKNNTTVEVEWNAIVPDEFERCPEPAGYTVQYWWDGNSAIYTTNTTNSSYTFTPEDLKGGKILHICVQEQYGNGSWDDVKRTKESSAVITLFVESVSEVLEYRLKYGSIINGVSTHNPVVTAAWEAEGQAAAQVRFGGITYPVVWGSQDEYRIPHIYENGTYALQVRIQDKNGVWTEWAPEKYYKIHNDVNDNGGVSIVVKKTEEGAAIQIVDGVGEIVYTKYQWAIFRNGVLIAHEPYRETMGYEDKDANGECAYQVWLMDSVGGYYKSNVVVLDVTQKTDTLRTETGEIIKLRYTAQFPMAYTYRSTEEVYMSHFAGGKYPVAMRSGKKNRSIPLAYVDKGDEIAKKLEELAGTEVLFKDVLGGKMKGILNDVNAGYGKIFASVSFTITAVDWVEEVPYIWED